MSPIQSNGKHSSSCQTGLKPLFLTTHVLKDTVRADVAAVSVASVGAEYLAPAVVADSGRNGEWVQSGMWRET